MHCEGTGLQKLQTPNSKALAISFKRHILFSSPSLASLLVQLNCLTVNCLDTGVMHGKGPWVGMDFHPSRKSCHHSFLCFQGHGQVTEEGCFVTKALYQLANVPVINHSPFHLCSHFLPAPTLSSLMQELSMNTCNEYLLLAIFRKG